MPKNQKLKMAAALIALLLTAPLAAAGAWAIVESTLDQVANILSFGVVGVVEGASIATAALIKANPCVYAGSSPADQCDVLGRKVPVDATIRAMNVLFINAFMPLFISLFLLLGLYMIFMQGSPKGRAEAKAFFIDLTVGMVLVGLSPVIYQIALNISSGLTEELWNMSGVTYLNVQSMWQTDETARVYCCFFWIALVTTMCALLVAGFRYFMVMLFACLFPLSLFLYTFRFTKGIGNTLMKFSLLAIFTQVIMMAFLVLGLKALVDPSFGVPAFRILFGIASMVALMCTPLILLKVMHWIGGAVYAYSSRGGGAGIRGISQLMRGKGMAQVLATAAGRYQTTHTLGMYERGGDRMAVNPGWSTVGEEEGGGRYPGFPHGGVISWDPYIFGSGGRFGRLRAGYGIAGLAGGGGGGGGGPVSSGMPPGLGASASNATPASSERAKRPMQPAPLVGAGTPQSGAPPSPVGGTGADTASAQAPEAPEQAPSSTPAAPTGGGGWGGAGPESVMPKLTLQQQQLMQAYTQPDEVGGTEAEFTGAQAPMSEGKSKSPRDISGRLAAIQKKTAERIGARRQDLEKYKMWAAKQVEVSPRGAEPEGEPNTHAPIPGFVHPPRHQPAPRPKGPQGEPEPPDWYHRAKGEGFGDINKAVGTLAQSGGQAHNLLDQVENAKGSGAHQDKTPDELLELAKKGKLGGK